MSYFPVQRLMMRVDARVEARSLRRMGGTHGRTAADPDTARPDGFAGEYLRRLDRFLAAALPAHRAEYLHLAGRGIHAGGGDPGGHSQEPRAQQAGRTGDPRRVSFCPPSGAHHRLPLSLRGGDTRRRDLRARAAWSALAGLALHAFFDGALIAAGFWVSMQLGILLFLAIFLHKIPEGFTAASIMRASGRSGAAVVGAAAAISISTLPGS